jgi:flagellin
MRELAVQSSNDTNFSTDRTALNNEFQQLTKEIARIADNTQWNGMNLMNNTAVGVAGLAGDVGVGSRNVTFQVGANANQTINIGLGNFSFGTGTPAKASTAAVSLGSEDLSGALKASVKIGATTFTVDATLSAIATPAEAKTLATAFQTAIQNTVGFENTTVTNSGNSLLITDDQGRVISTFQTDAAANGTLAAMANDAQAFSYTAGSAAVGATVPAAGAVFSGNARINDQSITDQAKASSAITHLDAAIQAVDTARAGFGAVMNRLTYASDNLTNVSQNASASRSRILDTDYAKTSTELARTQIISQAATAMLAQANQSQQSVLALLK